MLAIQPVIGAFSNIVKCNEGGGDLIKCIENSVDDDKHPGVARNVCDVLDATAQLDVNISIPADRCGHIAGTKEDVKALKRITAKCATLGADVTALQQVTDACKDSVNKSTNLPVVLGIAIPFGIMGLIVIFSCLRLLYRIRVSETAVHN